MQSMTTRQHRYRIRLLLAALLAGAAAHAEASSTSVTINATVAEVQCTAEQRTRIRACAPAQEALTIEPAKAIAGVDTVGAMAAGARYEITLDPAHPVLIKTVLY
jgi:hypothetical protein